MSWVQIPSPAFYIYSSMSIGNLVKHITQDKWGIILETVDYSEHIPSGLYCNILWNDEPEPFWVWSDIIRIVK